ncbi:MAG: 16S rRNA (uracil(1498)-N(3))-methyltransferase [bacterium]|nr:16S rRNA (uracil(1498)-N(3))-methyltransferase [bacterium]
MPYFFIPSEDIQEKKATLKGAAAKHLKQVLRATVGEEIILFDGEGNQYIGKIDSLGKEISVTILQKRKVPENPVKITLAQAWLKKDKMEWVIQKATELGVEQILPFSSSRTIPKWSGGEKQERWDKIALAAAEQCGRATLPTILPAASFEKTISSFETCDVKLILWEKETEKHLKDIFREPFVGAGLRQRESEIKNLLFVIGPEGGFSEEEVTAAQKNGFIPVSLGQRILRAETAALSVLTILQYELGGL